jgi:hypothetical protein
MLQGGPTHGVCCDTLSAKSHTHLVGWASSCGGPQIEKWWAERNYAERSEQTTVNFF